MIEAFSNLDPHDTFQFACHPGISCFNHCCRDLNQALTPYDVLRLRRELKIPSHEFLEHYTCGHTGPASGLPIVSLRFEDQRQRACPFVAPAGCRVYAARPASCRLYPLARALRRSRTDGRVSVHYAVIREPHCKGFDQSRTQTVASWIGSQDLATDFEMNDRLLALIALKNRLRPGLLPPEQHHLLRTALYDLDRFKTQVVAGGLNRIGVPHPDPDSDDDLEWLRWALDWIRINLFENLP